MDEGGKKRHDGVLNASSDSTAPQLIVRIKKLSRDARAPKLEHEGDAGYDLYADEETTLKPSERKLIGTGISVEIPLGYEGQVRPKSGLAIEHGITMLNAPGTIDSGYRGEIKVIVINLGNKEYKIEKGKKICQLVFNKIEHPSIEEAEALGESKRGTGGFGSTGLH